MSFSVLLVFYDLCLNCHLTESDDYLPSFLNTEWQDCRAVNYRSLLSHYDFGMSNADIIHVDEITLSRIQCLKYGRAHSLYWVTLPKPAFSMYSHTLVS
jgi:hypothetical protein